MSANRRNEFPQLQAAIDALADAPVILVWVQSRPRITTMRPIAQQLAASGFCVVVGYSPSVSSDPETMGFDDRTPCFCVPDDAVADLTGVDVFLSVEIAVDLGPRDAKRIGIHHSLPDRSLQRDYAGTLMRDPSGMASMDYYAILSCQKAQDWTVDNYAPHVDRQIPASLLRHRRESLAIVPFGYPKIDRLMAVDTSGDALDTITYAPTRSTLGWGSAMEAGADILAALLDGFPEYRVAFRPYPGADVARTRPICERFLDDPRFTLDDSPTGEALLRRTALMVSDQSSVAMSFGLGYARPVIFYVARPRPFLQERGTVPIDPIGLRVTGIDTLRQSVGQLLRDASQIKKRIERRRGAFIYNPGRSIEYLVEIMPDIIAGRSRPEWLEVPRRPFRAATPAGYRAQYAHVIGKVPARAIGSRKRMEKHLAPGFAHPAELFLRRGAGWSLRKMRGLRRYLSRPRGRS